jgi:delta24-sterol reductase
MPESHADRVAAVARQIASRPAGAKITIRKNTPGHSIRDQAYKQGLHAVDVSALDHVLGIDTGRRVVHAEGQVTMGQLAAATFEKGFLPAVVPEYRKFTVSGLINGEGIQSSSHRYGLFTHTLESVEIATADGRIVTASRTQNGDLFDALPESLGTLGIVVSATIGIVPAKPFVKLTYRRFERLDGYAAAFRDALDGSDFHEGVIYGPRCHVLLTGQFADDPGGVPVFDVERDGAPYYFQHVRDLACAAPIAHEAMPSLAYLARPERGMWWMLECHAGLPVLSETEWGRRQMDRSIAGIYGRSGLAPTDLTTEQRDRCLISQDMGVRIERLVEGVRWIQQHLLVYPIWNCAIRLPEPSRRHYKDSTYLVDLGIYGEPMVADYRRIAAMRALQTMADVPSLWGVSYLSWDEIERTSPERFERYERARRQVNADVAFLHLRDKVVWVDPSLPDPGKIPFWRLQRSYGRKWFLNPVCYLLLALGLACKAVWPRPAALR